MHNDPAPLLTLAAEQQSERLAMVRSLRRDATGLGPRPFTRLVRLLEVLASSHFSDGLQTRVRTRVLGDYLRWGRATVFRALADATKLGIVETEARYHETGRQCSSVRSIRWARVRELAGHQSTQSIPAPPPRQLRRGPSQLRPSPVSIETPYTDLSRDTNKGSGIPDHESKPKTKTESQPADHHIEADAIADRVAIAFDRLGYRGDDGFVLWGSIAAIDAGLLAPADVGRTLEACKASPGTKGPGYFRRVLADKSGLGPEGLTSTLRRVAIVWGEHSPGARPRPPSSALAPRPAIQAVPTEQRPNANQKRNQILRQLAEAVR